MSGTTIVDPLPILPENHPPDPLIQCGVLYLGSAPTNPGLRALDSIQEPFSRRYPVDGTNKVRGIDAVLSIYENGIQLAFIRQPHSVIFFPISALVYCASVRFTIIESEQSKASSFVDWRFMPLDEINHYENKHPPSFCAVVRRTQFLPGEECHCFITQSLDSAMALVRTISQVYANNSADIPNLKSPIFYQLDRFGRKLSETSGIIYISPANDEDPSLTRTHTNRITDEVIARKYLFDSSYNGFFYRTDASLIEQWQLWDDDDDVYQSRPRPPPSPFGLHEGLYHDDTTNELQRYLRHMDEEEEPQQQEEEQEHSSCSCSSSTSSESSCTTHSSCSTESSRKATRSRANKSKTLEDSDQFNLPLSNLQSSSFEPVQRRSKKSMKKRPIIIEKMLPPPINAIPILHPQLPVQSFEPPPSSSSFPAETQVDYRVQPDSTSISYQINDRGEKITKEGNRIVYMDVVQMNPNLPPIDSHSHPTYQPRLQPHRHRAPKQIPVIDMQAIESIFEEKNSKTHRRTKLNINELLKESSKSIKHIISPEQSEVLDRYLPDYHRHSSKSSHRTESSDRTKQRPTRKTSITPSVHSSKNGSYHRHHHHNHPAITTGPGINYVERTLPQPVTSNQVLSTTSTNRGNSPFRPVLTDAKLNEYISNIYGTTRSVHSTSSSATTATNRRTNPSTDRTAVENPNYTSAFRHVQNSFNRDLLDEYRHAY